MGLCDTIKHHNKNENACKLGFWHFVTFNKIVGFSASLSANKGVNQQIMRFTPFSTPKNLL